MDEKKGYSIIRADRSGVFFGKVASLKGRTAKILKARQIFYWTKANTCLQIAKDGIGADSRVTVEVEELTLSDAIEVIPCTEKAEKIIEALPEWKA